MKIRTIPKDVFISIIKNDPALNSAVKLFSFTTLPWYENILSGEYSFKIGRRTVNNMINEEKDFHIANLLHLETGLHAVNILLKQLDKLIKCIFKLYPSYIILDEAKTLYRELYVEKFTKFPKRTLNSLRLSIEKEQNPILREIKEYSYQYLDEILHLEIPGIKSLASE